MAKIIELYRGYDSYGRSIEMALSESKTWFYRVYEFNGYAKAWSKWATYNEPVVYVEKSVNVYSLEEYDVEPLSLIEWGFNKLSRWQNTPLPKYRLPA